MASELDLLLESQSDALLDMDTSDMRKSFAPYTRTVALNEPTEVWWRESHRVGKDVVARLGYDKYVDHISVIRTSRKHPFNYLNDQLPSVVNWQLWVLDGDEAKLYNRDSEPDARGLSKPLRRAPAWRAWTDPEDLLKMCRAYDSAGWDRIFIVEMFKRSGPDQQRVMDFLHRVGAAFPNVVLHLHNMHTFRSMFGLNFRAVDYDPYAIAQKKIVSLPNGTRLNVYGPEILKRLKWVHVLGCSIPELRESVENRVVFNFNAALWAAEHYSSPDALINTRRIHRPDPMGLFAPKFTPNISHSPMQVRLGVPEHDPDTQPQTVTAIGGEPVEPYALVEPITNLPYVPIQPRKKTTYDKILCDPCSLKDKCRYFRDGGLCILPGSPAGELARLFQSRDAEQIRLALSAVLSHQAARLGRVSEAWDDDDIADLGTDEVVKRSEHQMKLENSLSRGAETMIKILDPSQRTPATSVTVDARSIHTFNPAVLVADVVKQLQAAGIDRDSIKPEAILELAREKGMIEATPSDG
ncbi:MAG: hypothetical protein M3O41_14300 [Pseudomonadota bacterium]|nr:hypothetical protein [Pseudomonadota bacterium]